MRDDVWMDDLVAFLKARLDEDEAAARAATAGDWYATGEDILIRGLGPHWDGACVANASGADGEHIARHDPARVLREVEVKRKLIAVYEDANGGYSPDHFDGYWDAVWQFAAVYSDHPDYRPEWDFTAAS